MDAIIAVLRLDDAEMIEAFIDSDVDFVLGILEFEFRFMEGNCF